MDKNVHVSEESCEKDKHLLPTCDQKEVLQSQTDDPTATEVPAPGVQECTQSDGADPVSAAPPCESEEPAAESDVPETSADAVPDTPSELSGSTTPAEPASVVKAAEPPAPPEPVESPAPVEPAPPEPVEPPIPVEPAPPEPDEPPIPVEPAPPEPVEPPAPPKTADPTGLPALEVQQPVSLFCNGLTGFGITQQGQSHIRHGNVPCQDSMEVRLLKAAPIFMAAVADGVGECELSHYGSRTAVHTALDVLQERLEHLASQPDFKFRDHQQMQGVMLEAFRAALHAVDELAAELGRLPYSFQSTLTAAVYDGTQLYIGHAGDDGVVALDENGTCKMLTRRHKGETSNSVYPLQARNMDFIAVEEKIAALALMTDGVLDAVVDPEAFGNRVYYPFFRQLFETVLISEKDVQDLCDSTNAMLASKEYRERVTDDLSLVVLTNQMMMARIEKPQFDAEAWDKQTQEIVSKINERLYRKDPPAPNPRPQHKQPPKSGKDIPPPAHREPRKNPPRPPHTDPGLHTYVYSPHKPYVIPPRPTHSHYDAPADCKPVHKPPRSESDVDDVLRILRELGESEDTLNWVHNAISSETGGIVQLQLMLRSLRGGSRDVIQKTIDILINQNHKNQ